MKIFDKKDKKNKSKRGPLSYHGNTFKAQMRQLLNLLPGDSWNRKLREKIKLDCFWYEGVQDHQKVYEMYEEDKELKDWKFLNDWWDDLSMDNKKYCYKEMTRKFFSPEEKEIVFDKMYACIEKRIAKGV